LIRPIDSKSAEGGFARFRLHPSLLRAVAAAGFTEPRPIQVQTIPACMKGEDVMGLAQTGTGKTAAFALPILQRLLEEPGAGPLVLILSPTRELAHQIDAEFRTLAKFTKIRSTTIFGGVSASRQIQALRGRPEIVVGCPGRILDLLNQRKLDLSQVETLVLDEADQMFDMGFLPDVKRILRAVPDDAQRLLFSATMPQAIRDLAASMLHRPHVVELAHTSPAERIDHYLCPTPQDRKRELLDAVLDEDDCETAIVFTRTKHRAKRLAQQLAKRGLRAVGLQGNMSQPQRDRAMNGFRDGKFDVLVATDIAARGLDVAGVSYVINFDPPSTAEIYTHRIGRTGRSGESGIACTFVTAEDAAWVRATERVLKQRIPLRRYPGFEDEVLVAPANGARQRSANGRDSANPDARGASHAGPGRSRRRRSRRPGSGSAGASGRRRSSRRRG
jgi:superfamily II DNA/RNA helicase